MFFCTSCGATNFCDISHCFNQSPLLFDSFGCVRSKTEAFNSNPRAMFSIEISSHCLHVFLDLVIFSIGLYAFSTWWSAYPVVKVYTHQRDPLLVECDRCCNGTFVDVFSPIPVHKYCHIVLVLESSSTHDNVSMARLPYLSFVLPPRLRKQKERPICCLEALELIFRFFHLSSVTSCSSVARRK